jgi:hypothetical protein
VYPEKILPDPEKMVAEPKNAYVAHEMRTVSTTVVMKDTSINGRRQFFRSGSGSRREKVAHKLEKREGYQKSTCRLRMSTSCACVLLAHAYFLRMRIACAWQRTDSLSAASLLRCACSARKSSSGRTDCSRVRMRLLCSHTGHRHPVPGLHTFAKSKKVTGIGEMNMILLYHNCRIRGSDQCCGSGSGRIRNF